MMRTFTSFLKSATLMGILFAASVSAFADDCLDSELAKIRTDIQSLNTMFVHITDLKTGFTYVKNPGEDPTLFISYSYRERTNGGSLPFLTDREVVGQNEYTLNCQLLHRGQPVTVK